MELVISTLSENQYFSAGFGLFGVGALAAAGRRLTAASLVLFRRHCITTLEIPCNDKSYFWILDWLTKRGARKTQHLSIRTSFEETDSGKARTSYSLVPSLGTHVFRHNTTNRWIKIDRTREQHMQDIIGGTPWETVTLTSLGNQKDLFLSIVEEARTEALLETEGKTVTYVSPNSGSNDWVQFGKPKDKRSLNSVILRKGAKEKIVLDAEEFIKNSQWYKDREIPYRRGYLLYGPPGCGKTSFIKALAGHLNFDICVLNLAEADLTDLALAKKLSQVPDKSILLLEDVDAAFASRSSSPNANMNSQQISPRLDSGLNRLTFSGLLNAIDGIITPDSTEPQLLFLTTNYKERLDSALIRPGRVDFQLHVDYCDQHQAKMLYERFYPSKEKSNRNSQKFVDDLFSNIKQNDSNAECKISAAQLQGYFMQYKFDENEAITNSHELMRKL